MSDMYAVCHGQHYIVVDILNTICKRNQKDSKGDPNRSIPHAKASEASKGVGQSVAVDT